MHPVRPLRSFIVRSKTLQSSRASAFTSPRPAPACSPTGHDRIRGTWHDGLPAFPPLSTPGYRACWVPWTVCGTPPMTETAPGYGG